MGSRGASPVRRTKIGAHSNGTLPAWNASGASARLLDDFTVENAYAPVIAAVENAYAPVIAGILKVAHGSYTVDGPLWQDLIEDKIESSGARAFLRQQIANTDKSISFVLTDISDQDMAKLKRELNCLPGGLSVLYGDPNAKAGTKARAPGRLAWYILVTEANQRSLESRRIAQKKKITITWIVLVMSLLLLVLCVMAYRAHTADFRDPWGRISRMARGSLGADDGTHPHHDHDHDHVHTE